MKFRHTFREEKISLQMTPMIDIVFQLNIFFLFTFKIILPEGDFNVRMPSAAAARAAEPSETMPLLLVMKADPGGALADLQMAGRSFGTGREAFVKLRQYVRGLINDAGGPGTAADQEVELSCDYDLQYHYVIAAIDAVTGYIEGGERHKLVDKIRFGPPKRAGPAQSDGG
jgi:biopolymer transport protein ExbD